MATSIENRVNPFTSEFLKWTIPSMNLDISIDANRGFSQKIKKNRMANSVAPDDAAAYDSSHLNIHCLHRYLFWSVVLKGLINASNGS